MDIIDGAASVAVIGYVNAFKQFLPVAYQTGRITAILSVLCGILYAFQLKPLSMDTVYTSLITGVTVGLAASGMYSGGKAIAGK